MKSYALHRTSGISLSPGVWFVLAEALLGAFFRADAARYPDDPEFDRIAEDLARVSPEFAGLWARHDAAEHTTAVKAVDHPEAGLLVFDAMLFPVPEHPGHHLILHNPRPGTYTAERLQRLMRSQPGGATPTMN